MTVLLSFEEKTDQMTLARAQNWDTKFMTGKFRPGIAFAICTNQFHLQENDHEVLKLVSKMTLKKWNTNFCLEYSVQKNRTTCSDVLLLPKKSCSGH